MNEVIAILSKSAFTSSKAQSFAGRAGAGIKNSVRINENSSA